jgi:hypothetical protein
MSDRYTEKCCAHIESHVNRWNDVYWADTNPHVTIDRVVNSAGIIVWGGICSAGLLGPYFFDEQNGGVTVTQHTYLNVLNGIVLPWVEQNGGRAHWFYQQDGAPPHYALTVRTWLNEQFEDRWIGRRGPLDWPPRSPDQTPMDFGVWGITKEKVYAHRVETIPALRQIIHEQMVAYFDEQVCSTICRSVPRRLARLLDPDINGGQFEHLDN